LSLQYIRPKSLNIALRFALLVCLLTLIAGCQQLFHASDAPLKGQTVTVSVTVPEKPLPVVKPIKNSQKNPDSTVKKATPPLQSRLIPKTEPRPTEQFKITTDTPSSDLAIKQKATRSAILKADKVIEGRVLTEDLVLRGTVLIRGTLVVSPNATLRIEQGTVIRFISQPLSEQLSQLVVQGRLVIAGTFQKPVLFAPAFDDAMPGDWGGLLLMNSEKKNILDCAKIEGAKNGIAAYFSNFTGRGLKIEKAVTGIALYDAEARLQDVHISRCDTACKTLDGELELREGLMHENRQGLFARNSSFSLINVKIVNNSQEGIFTEQSRYRISNGVIAENRTGATLNGGEGQITLTRFQQNRENGLELKNIRIKINNSLFTGNSGFGIQMENTRGIMVGSALYDNKISNLHNKGDELFIAILNWWGSLDEIKVSGSITDSGMKSDNARVLYIPFLKLRPAVFP